MGFNPGDKVKVTCKDNSDVYRGWADSWVSHMDKHVTHIGCVNFISGGDGGISVDFDNGDNWMFPWWCLLKV
jgi:hypothetical protein